MAAASNADLLATQAIILALGQVGIDVLDHVILTPTDWFSMAEHGRVPQYNPGTGQLLFAAPQAEVLKNSKAQIEAQTNQALNAPQAQSKPGMSRGRKAAGFALNHTKQIKNAAP